MSSLARFVRIGFFAVLVLAGLAAGPRAAWSQPVICGERYALLEQLEQKFSERRTAYGLTADGRLVEVFVGPSGSWTILATAPGGPTCLVSSGAGWQEIDKLVEGPLA